MCICATISTTVQLFGIIEPTIEIKLRAADVTELKKRVFFLATFIEYVNGVYKFLSIPIVSYMSLPEKISKYAKYRTTTDTKLHICTTTLIAMGLCEEKKKANAYVQGNIICCISPEIYAIQYLLTSSPPLLLVSATLCSVSIVFNTIILPKVVLS